MRAVTLHAQMEDTPHNGGGILVDQPVVLILRVLPVAVDRMVGGGLASVSSGLICRTLFPAAIPQKPFVYDMIPDFYQRTGTIDTAAYESLLPEVYDEDKG